MGGQIILGAQLRGVRQMEQLRSHFFRALRGWVFQDPRHRLFAQGAAVSQLNHVRARSKGKCQILGRRFFYSEKKKFANALALYFLFPQTSWNFFLFSLMCLRSEEHTSELQSRQYLVC